MPSLKMRGARIRVGRPRWPNRLVLQQDVVGVEQVEDVHRRLDGPAEGEPLTEPEIDELVHRVGAVLAALLNEHRLGALAEAGHRQRPSQRVAASRAGTCRRS